MEQKPASHYSPVFRYMGMDVVPIGALKPLADVEVSDPETARLIADRATLFAAKRYIQHANPYVDRAVLMAILGMEPDVQADAAV